MRIFKKILLLAIILVGFVFFLLFSSRNESKIYDCFLFFNELELLEVRLNEMAPYVDRFVLVESCETFRGEPKPFYFAENRDKFAQFADKIIYVPLHQHLETDNPWIRERWQRQQIFRGLSQCSKRDIIFLSDIDEIVRRESIPKIAKMISTQEAQAVVCRQKMYFGFMNRYQCDWSGSVCTSYQTAKRITAKKMRRLRNTHPKLLRKTRISKICTLDNAGWHFTSMGGLNRYIKKIESYSHSEADTPFTKTDAHRMSMIRSFTLEEVDESFPQFVQNNKTYFEQIGFLELSKQQPHAP
jgi:hypothetical protein